MRRSSESAPLRCQRFECSAAVLATSRRTTAFYDCWLALDDFQDSDLPDIVNNQIKQRKEAAPRDGVGFLAAPELGDPLHVEAGSGRPVDPYVHQSVDNC